MDEMTSVFLEESRDNIENISENILKLEKDSQNVEIINELFRSAHTLKGMYATMGFDKFAELTHKMEDFMDKIREREIEVTSEKIDILLACVAVLEEMTTEFEKTNNVTVDIQEYIDSLDLLFEKDIENMDTSIIKSNNTYNNEHELILIDIEINDVEMKMVRTFMMINNIENSLEIISSTPSKDELFIEDNNSELVNKITIEVKKDNMTTEKLLQIIRKAGDDSDSSLINNITINNKIQELKENTDKDTKEETLKKIETIPNTEKEDKVVKTSKTHDNKENQIVRIESQKIDNIMNLVAEMVTEKNRLELRGKQLKDMTLEASIERIDRIIASIQDIVMKVRMVEMEHTFKIFPREIRNISKKLGKKVNLEILGGDTELDRTVVDQIKNPLVHIIKNSLDHGIETPEERIAKGKNEYGNLQIKAHYEGNQVVITVKDDGKGIDGEMIAEKAIEKNLLSRQKVEGMTLQEKVNLICMPGFSTAESVTELSGRGVGLDAVRSFVEQLNGTMEIESQKDVGTTIKLYVPLTLAIIQSMLIGIHDEVFAMPLHSIEAIVSIDDVEHKNANAKEVIVYKKNTIPVIHLSDIVKTEKDIEKEEFIILAKKAGKMYGIIVHEIIGQQEIVIKSLGEHLRNVKEYSGATILGDGSVSLILDVGNILK